MASSLTRSVLVEFLRLDTLSNSNQFTGWAGMDFKAGYSSKCHSLYRVNWVILFFYMTPALVSSPSNLQDPLRSKECSGGDGFVSGDERLGYD